MNDATGINLAYARGARITLAIGVALGLFLLPLLRAQEPMVEAEAEGQLLVDQQRLQRWAQVLKQRENWLKCAQMKYGQLVAKLLAQAG